MENQIRILLADDHKILSEGLQTLLQVKDAYEVVGMVNNGPEVLEFIENQKVDLIILDINMPVMDGISTIVQLKEIGYEGKILVLSSYEDLKLVHDAFLKGADGYITKKNVAEVLFQGITSVFNDKVFYDPIIEKKVLTDFASRDLSSHEQERAIMRQITDRELEVLKLIASEYTSDEIAKQLFISKGTVDTHRKNLIRKLKVRNAVGLAHFAIRNKII